MADFTKNAGDPDEVKGAGKQARRIAWRRLGFYKTVLATPEGRAVLADVLALTGCLTQSTFALDAGTLYFNEGRRNIGLQLRAELLEMDEHAVDLMEQEERQRRRQDAEETWARQTRQVSE